jgi:hypothetical protein
LINASRSFVAAGREADPDRIVPSRTGIVFIQLSAKPPSLDVYRGVDP